MDVHDTQVVHDLLQRRGQAQALLTQAKQLEAIDRARYYAALVTLATDPNFELVLMHIFQTVFLLNEAKTPEDFGRQKLFLLLLQDMRNARAASTMAMNGAT